MVKGVITQDPVYINSFTLFTNDKELKSDLDQFKTGESDGETDLNVDPNELLDVVLSKHKTQVKLKYGRVILKIITILVIAIISYNYVG